MGFMDTCKAVGAGANCQLVASASEEADGIQWSSVTFELAGKNLPKIRVLASAAESAGAEAPSNLGSAVISCSLGPWDAEVVRALALNLEANGYALGLGIDEETLVITTTLFGPLSNDALEKTVLTIAEAWDTAYGEIFEGGSGCASCGAELADGARFCPQCGAPAAAGGSSARPSQTGNDSADSVIESGTYLVGREIAPGLYRYSGYFARVDSRHSIIDNGNTSSGTGLFRVHDSDDLVEINGQAMAIEQLPQVDPIGERYRDGTYLVGVDIPSGRYRVSDPGGTAFAFVKDRNLATTRSEMNNGSVIVTLSSADYALEFSGLLERL